MEGDFVGERVMERTGAFAFGDSGEAVAPFVCFILQSESSESKPLFYVAAEEAAPRLLFGLLSRIS